GRPDVLVAPAARAAAFRDSFTPPKPYFAPEGLIVAAADGRPVGFAHAGFGPNADGSALDPCLGITCAVGVLPAYRRQGVGTQLLRRCEEYLTRKGARELLAGPLAPNNPFLFGLYGGSSSPGFLESDPLARPFLEGRGYRLCQTCLVFQHPLERLQLPSDSRFSAHRQRYEIHAAPAARASWGRECVLGPVELVEYRLLDRGTGQADARLTLWEMDAFSQQWNEHAVGLLDLEVVPDRRRQGLAKFLLSQILRHLHEQFFSLLEVQAPADNAA